ncbi:MAG TPA: hypothetical protein DIW44_16090 [Anaerolineaceae bacterium]|nr:hypothetical protein [Anaerolineaceae bacterium]
MKKFLKNLRTWLMIAICLSLSACNLPAGNSSASDIAIQQTSVAQTVVVLQTQLAANETPALPQISTNTPGADQPAATFTSTATVIPPTPTITNTPAPTFRISKVTDVTFPDDTLVKPNTEFTKTWRITNGGTGTWTPGFKLVFISGDALGGPASVAIGQTVLPGNSIDLSVKLKSPGTTKTYQGKWMLQTDTGTTFGLGTNADGSFWVRVKVDQNLAVTAATVSVAPAAYNGPCPGALAITASVTANTSGKITYYFITSLGNSGTLELTFDAAGAKTTPVFTLPVLITGPVTISFYNDYPNHQEFGAVTIPVTCTP